MTRAKKALYTSIASTAHQIIAIICGFILPRLFLMRYGSSVNGLVSSITQFLGFISLAELGIGVVVQSSLYKPLAYNDIEEISRIYKSCASFFQKIAIILFVYSTLLTIFYPIIVIDKFDYFYTASLIVVISISTFAQHYVGMPYRILLGADQYGFISQAISCITLILNTGCCAVLIEFGMPIHFVKLSSSLIFLVQPIILLLIGKRKYPIQFDVTITEEPIKQKWNGLAQHISAVVLNNTDIVILTLFSTIENVSVYYVYYMVVNGVKSIVSAFTSGYVAMFGNMLAKDETEEANNTFGKIEWLIHTVTTQTFGLTIILIIPFVMVYTRGVTDYNYINPSFGIILTIAFAAYCIRLPYNIMVMAAGHYKQTQNSAIIEAIINICLSIVFVSRYDLLGVAIGTLVAMLFRTVYLVAYLSKNIIYRKISHFLRHIIVDVLCMVIIVLCSNIFLNNVMTFMDWFLLALKYGVISFVVVVGVNFVFYKKELLYFIHKSNRKEGTLGSN